MATLYPVCVAHAFDRMPADKVVAVSSRLILVSGLGSVLGPLAGTGLMRHFDIDGVLYMMAAAAVLLAFAAAGRSLIMAPPRHLARHFDILAPQAASLAHDQFRADRTE
jgi:MFS family permease